MAKYYCNTSCFLTLNKEQVESARTIVEQTIERIEKEDDGLEVFQAAVDFEEDGIWFHSEENCNPYHVAQVAQALLEAFKIEEPFEFSWSYTCSKPVLEGFGGGAAIVRANKEVIWVDALAEARSKLERLKDNQDA